MPDVLLRKIKKPFTYGILWDSEHNFPTGSFTSSYNEVSVIQRITLNVDQISVEIYPTFCEISILNFALSASLATNCTTCQIYVSTVVENATKRCFSIFLKKKTKMKTKNKYRKTEENKKLKNQIQNQN